mgnify:CR=1 FL=1
MPDLDCERARRLIHLRLDGELAADDAARLDAHLARCARCRRALDELLRIDAALREGLAAAEPPPQLAARVRARLAEARPARPAWTAWLPAAAALLLAAGLVIFGLSRIGPGTSDHPRPAPMPLVAPAVVISGGDAIHVFEPDRKTSQPGHTGDELQEQSVAWGLGGSTISLQFAGGARITLSDESVVRIGRDSVDLFKGDLNADLSEATGAFTVVTPWGEMRAQGALFDVSSRADEETAQLSVTRGEVSVQSRDMGRTVAAGQTIQLRPDPGRVFEL